MYVFPCVILFLYFSVLSVLRLPRFGKRELILVLFVRFFGLCLFRLVGGVFLLEFGKGCGLCLFVCHFVHVFFGPFSVAVASLGEDGANLSAFRTFVLFVLV